MAKHHTYMVLTMLKLETFSNEISIKNQTSTTKNKSNLKKVYTYKCIYMHLYSS